MLNTNFNNLKLGKEVDYLKFFIKCKKFKYIINKTAIELNLEKNKKIKPTIIDKIKSHP